MRFSWTALTAFAFCLASTTAYADDTGFASAHDLQKEGGRLCMASHAHAGSGEGKSKPAALKAAHNSWYEYTAWEYGSDWAKWSKAASKAVQYTKTDAGWSAWIESRPCK